MTATAVAHSYSNIWKSCKVHFARCGDLDGDNPSRRHRRPPDSPSRRHPLSRLPRRIRKDDFLSTSSTRQPFSCLSLALAQQANLPHPFCIQSRTSHILIETPLAYLNPLSFKLADPPETISNFLIYFSPFLLPSWLAPPSIPPLPKNNNGKI